MPLSTDDRRAIVALRDTLDAAFHIIQFLTQPEGASSTARGSAIVCLDRAAANIRRIDSKSTSTESVTNAD